MLPPMKSARFALISSLLAPILCACEAPVGPLGALPGEEDPMEVPEQPLRPPDPLGECGNLPVCFVAHSEGVRLPHDDHYFADAKWWGDRLRVAVGGVRNPNATSEDESSLYVIYELNERLDKLEIGKRYPIEADLTFGWDDAFDLLMPRYEPLTPRFEGLNWISVAFAHSLEEQPVDPVREQRVLGSFSVSRVSFSEIRGEIHLDVFGYVPFRQSPSDGAQDAPIAIDVLYRVQL